MNRRLMRGYVRSRSRWLMVHRAARVRNTRIDRGVVGTARMTLCLHAVHLCSVACLRVRHNQTRC